MLCARECPDWCIYIEGHKEKAPPRREGGKPRQRNKLDRFDIDFALCMYCGICVEVCPFDALFWSPEYEYSEPRIADLLHDKDRLGEWMETVPDFEDYEAGSRGQKVKRCRRMSAVACSLMVAQNISFCIIAAVIAGARRLKVVTTRNIVHAALCLVRRARRRRRPVHPAAAPSSSPSPRSWSTSAPSSCCSCSASCSPGATLGDDDERRPAETRVAWPRSSSALLLAGGHGATPCIDDLRATIELADRRARSTHRRGLRLASSRSYIVPFEAVSVLLLAALIGAIVVARKE